MLQWDQQQSARNITPRLIGNSNSSNRVSRYAKLGDETSANETECLLGATGTQLMHFKSF